MSAGCPLYLLIVLVKSLGTGGINLYLVYLCGVMPVLLVGAYEHYPFSCSTAVRLGDELPIILEVCPENGTAAPKG